MPSSAILETVAIALLILVNGFFSMAEMALVAARRFRLRAGAQEGRFGAAAAHRLAQEPDNFFSTVQVGITTVGVLTGVFSGATLGEHLTRFFAAQPGLAPYSDVLGVAAVVLPVTFVTLVFGELVPKRLALSRPERLACLMAPFMQALMKLSLPAVWLLSRTTSQVVRLLGSGAAVRPEVTEEDIRAMIGEGARAGVLERAERDMLERIFRFGDRPARVLMTHRSRMVWLNLEASREEILRTIREHPYSRYPVAAGELPEVVGVVRAKDLLVACLEGRRLDLRSHLRQPLYVPETVRGLRLLELFKEHPHLHMALVVDEYGDLQGLLTLNDILDAITGDFPGGATDGESAAVRREDGSWLLDGLMPADEALATVGILHGEEPGVHQTLAGFVLRRLGEVPSLGAHFLWRGHRFEIVDMDGGRIDRVLVSEAEPDGADAGQR